MPKKGSENVNSGINSTACRTMFDMSNEVKKDGCEECRRTKNNREYVIQMQEREIRDLKARLQLKEDKICKLRKSVEPYINNVELMSVIVDGLAGK